MLILFLLQESRSLPGQILGDSTAILPGIIFPGLQTRSILVEILAHDM